MRRAILVAIVVEIGCLLMAASVWLDRLLGGVLVGLGIRLAVAEPG